MAIAIAPLIVFNLTIMTFIQNYYIDQRLSQMRTRVAIMSGIVARHGFYDLSEEPTISRLRMQISQYAADWDLRILVVSPQARVIDDSNRDHADSLVATLLINGEILQALAGSDAHTLHIYDEVMSVTGSVYCEASSLVGAVMLVQSVRDIFASLEEIRQTLYLISIIVGIFVVVLVIIVSQQLIRPVRQIVSAVKKISEGQLNRRVPVSTRDEFSIFARAVNNMTEKLEAVERTREEFVSNVSHEMKSPLAAIKVLSESILLMEHAPEDVYREFFRDINEEVDRMTNINNDLLTLVRTDRQGEGLRQKTTNLNRLVGKIVNRLMPFAERSGVGLHFEGVRLVFVYADDIKLNLAITNIVENGIKYTPSGGMVRVTVDADNQHAYVTVRDTGIGIPEDELGKIFDRFYRVDKTRDRDTGGTGLGLSISRATVMLHGGSILVESTLGAGSVFIVRLPVNAESIGK